MKLKMMLGVFVMVFTSVMLAPSIANAVPVGPSDPNNSLESITVSNGDTLWSLFGFQWRDVASYNGITDPNLIMPGQVLIFPPGNYHAPVLVKAFIPVPIHSHVVQAFHPAVYAQSTSGWSGAWACIAKYESGGNAAANTGNGYYGGLQFSMGTWLANGGTGNPAGASISQQEAVAQRVLSTQGWGAWPNTSRMCGY